MRRLLFSGILPLAVTVIHADAVMAQPYAFGLGYYWSPSTGPVFGLTPFYYRGFWGNGMSMYGPPVPTYGPVAGVFNGSDYTATQTPPVLPLNPGFYHNLNRPSPSVYLPPPIPFPQPEDVARGPIASALVLEVHVPVGNAEVFVDGSPTKSTGEVRMLSVALPEGENHPCHVRAEWTQNGVKVSRTKITGGRAGQKLVVSFVN
jgi:uncharacterized protein (TIGR03000 family)